MEKEYDAVWSWPQRKPWEKPKPCFNRAFEAAEKDARNWSPVGVQSRLRWNAKLREQKTSEVAANTVLEGEGRTNEGGTMHPEVES